MINFKLPEFENLEKVRVRLNEPRMIIFKDERKSNPKQKTIIPLELQDHKGRKGVYIICRNDKVEYIGATNDFEVRMRTHVFLRKNPNIKFVYFLEEINNSKRLLSEMIYKYYYFGKVKVEWNYAGGDK